MKNKGIAGALVAVLLVAAALLALNNTGAFSQQTSDPQDGGDGVILGSEAAAPQEMLAPDPPLVGTGVIHLGAEAFQPYSQATTWVRNSTILLYSTTAGYQAFDAPVTLPNGARVKQVVFYYYDNDVTNDASLYWVTTPALSFTGLATPGVGTTGAANSIRYGVMTNFPNPIDNGSNSYFVRVNLPGNVAVALKSVRIEYGYDTALPAVRR